MRTRGVKSNLAALGGEARYQADLITIARTIDQPRADCWKNLNLGQAAQPGQGIGDHPSLPLELSFVAKVERLAAAALGKDRTRGLDPVVRTLQNVDHMGADVVLLDGINRYAHHFARQCAGYKGNKSVGPADSLAVSEEIIDVDWCVCEIDGRRVTRGVVRQGS